MLSKTVGNAWGSFCSQAASVLFKLCFRMGIMEEPEVASGKKVCVERFEQERGRMSFTEEY